MCTMYTWIDGKEIVVSRNSLPPPTTFYDVQNVADMFRMSRMTVYRAIRSGELPAVRIRGRWLVPKRVIDALIANAEAALPQHEQEV
jgi:excisionase family DNA binding protein